MSVDFDLFTKLFDSFDKAVVSTITTGSAAMIGLITPLVGAGFTLYVMLVMLSYLRGSTDHMAVDMFTRFVSWSAVIFFGLNVGAYMHYVVPFVSKSSDDLMTAIGASATPAHTMDVMAGQFVDGAIKLLKDASGFDIITAWFLVALLFLSALPFLAIAAGYLLLAKVALVVLLAVGPLYIAMALFPATRPFFTAWTAQCANYIFLSLLFGFLASVMVAFMGTVFTGDIGIIAVAKMLVAGVLMILVSLNLPSLASALAGGVGISTMVGKVAGPARAAYRGAKSLAGMLKSKGGSIGGA